MLSNIDSVYFFRKSFSHEDEKIRKLNYDITSTRAGLRRCKYEQTAKHDIQDWTLILIRANDWPIPDRSNSLDMVNKEKCSSPSLCHWQCSWRCGCSSSTFSSLRPSTFLKVSRTRTKFTRCWQTTVCFSRKFAIVFAQFRPGFLLFFDTGHGSATKREPQITEGKS